MPTEFALDERIEFDEELEKAQRTGSPTSSNLDCGDAEAQMLVLEVSSYTDGTHDFQFEASDSSGSGFAQVASTLQSGDSVPTVSGTGDTGTYKLGYIGNERYLRLNTTSGGGTTGATYAVYGLKNAERLPA